MKQIVKQEKQKETSKNVMRSRNVPAAVIAHWKRRIESIEDDIKAILEEEKVERQLRRAEMEVEKKINLIQHEDEIKSRPSRTWFQTETEKREIQKKSVENAKREYAEAKALLRKQKIKERKKRGEKNVGVGSHRMTRKKRRNRMAEMEANRDEQVSRKVGRIGGKIRVAKRKEREEEVKLEGKRKRKKQGKKKKKK
jgi:ATP-dependent RNA helicase DDX27